MDLRTLPAEVKRLIPHAQLPASYLAVRHAMTTCLKIDEVKDIADQATAMATLAREAGDPAFFEFAQRVCDQEWESHRDRWIREAPQRYLFVGGEFDPVRDETRCLESFCREAMNTVRLVFGPWLVGLYNVYWQARNINEGKIKMTQEMAFSILKTDVVAHESSLTKCMQDYVAQARLMLPDYAKLRDEQAIQGVKK